MTRPLYVRRAVDGGRLTNGPARPTSGCADQAGAMMCTTTYTHAARNLMRAVPVRADADVDNERYLQRRDARHQLGELGAQARDFRFGRLEDELIVDLQDQA